MGRYETGSFISSNNIFQNSNEVLQLLFLFYHDTHKSLTHKHATAPLSVFTIFFISTTCTPYTQLSSPIIPFSPAYRQSPKLSTVTVHAYVPSNGICRGFAFKYGEFLLPPRFLTALSVPKVSTREQKRNRIYQKMTEFCKLTSV